MKLFKSALAGALALALMAAPSLALAADNMTVLDSASATKTVRCVDVGSGILACTSTLADHLGNLIDPAVSYAATATTTITRPADTNAYVANDTWADSTSAPTTGGFTFTSACRTSGGSGVILSVAVVSSVDPATLLQGEIWIFDSAVTAVNDNAAFALSDGDALKLIPGGVIPFTLSSTTGGSGTNSYYTSGALNIGYTCSGSANLRYLVKVKNAYTPASAEALTVRLNAVGTN